MIDIDRFRYKVYNSYRSDKEQLLNLEVHYDDS